MKASPASRIEHRDASHEPNHSPSAVVGSAVSNFHLYAVTDSKLAMWFTHVPHLDADTSMLDSPSWSRCSPATCLIQVSRTSQLHRPARQCLKNTACVHACRPLESVTRARTYPSVPFTT